MNASDHEQAFAAGVLEGHLTHDLISLQLINTVGDFCEKESTSCRQLEEFLVDNFKWAHKQLQSKRFDPYWHHVSLVYQQFWGLYHGYYNLTAEKKTIERSLVDVNVLEEMIHDIRPFIKLMALQLNGDMSELLAAINKVSDPFMAGSCSALIKVSRLQTPRRTQISSSDHNDRLTGFCFCFFYDSYCPTIATCWCPMLRGDPMRSCSSYSSTTNLTII